ALALMLAAVVGSLSRGGVAALALGAAAVTAVRARAAGAARVGLVAVPLVLACGLLTLVGVRPLESRLASLWTGDALRDERWAMWENTLAAARHFPVVGS